MASTRKEHADASPRRPRCLFLACSGVRVRSRELQAIGVNLPGFVERGKVIASLPSLALLTLAAHTPGDWDIEYMEMADFEPERLQPDRYDLAAISSYTAQIDLAYQLSDTLRALGVRTVLGGLHVSALPDEAARHADAVVLGEGEYAWEQLCRDFERGALRPRYHASDFGPFRMEDARVPRYDLLDMDKYNRITVQTTRGCPHACDFCAASRTISTYKKKSVAQVVEEIKAVHALWPHPFIEFADDNTFVDKAWAKDLMRALIPLGIRWFTETDISFADDEELLDLASRAGCFQVLIGLESASMESMPEADPHGWKHERFTKYKDAIERIQRHGISVNGCFILGWDHDGPDIFDRTRAFVEALHLAEVQITLLTPFPNAPLYQKMRAEGRLFRDRYWEDCTLFDLTYLPKGMSPRQLETGLHSLFSDIYNDKATQRRKRVFKECVRAKHRRRSIPAVPYEETGTA